MAELATIARPYAEALFQSVASDASQASQWLDELAQFASDETLLQFADSPKVSAEQVFDVISGAAQTALPAEAGNFLRLVIENGRLAALPEIATQFRALKNARTGTADAIVYSAFDIDSSALADLSGLLEKRFGRQLNLSVQLAPELIGGIRVAVGDEVLDTSVQARLEQMKVALTA
jgi:F-type H+-transporting ATPase subunit delta